MKYKAYNAKRDANEPLIVDCLRKHGLTVERLCKVRDCKIDAYIKGYCNKHYLRMRRHGDVYHNKCRGRTKRGLVLKFAYSLASVEEETCINWPFPKTADGYAKFTYNKKSYRANRFACTVKNGAQPKDKPHAAHICGNRGCVNPSHLIWASAAENCSHKVMHGTEMLGEKHWKSKLVESQVLAIRKDPRVNRVIAKQYGVSKTTIAEIKRRESWSWLRDEVA